VPANIILACAILLKYKSNAIRFYDEPAPVEDAMPVEASEEPVQPLTLSWRIPPKRQITLQELVDEMERVIKYDTMERPKKTVAPLPMMDLKLDNYDLEGEMVSLLGRIRGGADTEGIVLFSSLVNGGGADGVISTMTPLLHLAQRKSILLRQDKFFGEIFINLGEGAPEGNGNGKEGNGEQAVSGIGREPENSSATVPQH
jgi:chromatin segregation and condensation protein Rec8/ScpA/Scc1 (kleisin family)